MTRLRCLTLRATVAALAFSFAIAALVWPIHYKAPTSLALYGARNEFTLSNYVMQSCPWHFQLGHMSGTIPTAPPPNADASRYLLNSYNDGVCAAKQYDRTSQALLWLLVGFGFTLSSIRRRRQPDPALPMVAATT